MNLADLRRTLGVDGDGVGVCGMGNSTMGHASEADDDGLYGADSKARQRRLSMERMDLLKVCFAYASPQLYVIFFYLLSCTTSSQRTSTFSIGLTVFCKLPWYQVDLFLFLFFCATLRGNCLLLAPTRIGLHLLLLLFLFGAPFSFWLLALCVIQLTPDVKHLHGQRLRQLHEMDAVWPRPLAGHPAAVKRDMLPLFVSVNPL